jgi:hypothetical protein
MRYFLEFLYFIPHIETILLKRIVYDSAEIILNKKEKKMNYFLDNFDVVFILS